MKLIFFEQIYNTIEIDEDVFGEYLNSCKEDDIIPSKDDFMEWLTGNFFISDFVKESDSDFEYTLTDKQFNKYLEQFDD